MTKAGSQDVRARSSFDVSRSEPHFLTILVSSFRRIAKSFQRQQDSLLGPVTL